MKLLLALLPQLAAAIVVGSLPEGSDGLPVASGHRPGWLARSGRSVVWFGYWIDAQGVSDTNETLEGFFGIVRFGRQ